MSRSIYAFSLIALMLMAPLSGCFGENEAEPQDASEVLYIDFAPAGEKVLDA